MNRIIDRFLIVALMIFSSLMFKSQNTDSLLNIYSSYKNDTNKVKKLLTLSELCLKKLQNEKTIICAKEAMSVSEKINYKSGVATSIYQIGRALNDKGNYIESNEHFFKALKLYQELNDKRNIAFSFHNIGLNYNEMGDYNKTIEYIFKSLKIKEEINDKKGISASLNSLGSAMQRKGELDKAIEYYNESIKIKEELGDKKGIASSLNNIGVIYTLKKDYEKAYDFFLKSLKIKEELNEKRNLTSSYTNIGVTFKERKEYDKAMEYYKKAIQNELENGSKTGLAKAYSNIGSLYLITNKCEDARIYAMKAVETASSINATGDLGDACNLTSKIDTCLGNFKSALYYYEIYSNIERKFLKEQSDQNINEERAKFESNKKEQLIAILNKDKEIQKSELEKQNILLAKNTQHLDLLAKENKLKELHLIQQKQELIQKNIYAENQKKSIELLNKDKALKEAEALNKESMLKQQKNITYFVSAGGFLILILLVVAYNGNVQKKKANAIIIEQKREAEKQKALVEAKQKEIIDSIKYAKRIQQSLMPTDRYIEKNIHSENKSANKF